MYYILTLFAGILTAVMIALNGDLADGTGVYLSTVIIHIVGLTLISITVKLRGDRPFAKRMPWHFYLGGLIGVATTVFNNLAFGRISVSAILALSLLAQSITSIIFDQFGLMGMARHPFNRNKLTGLILVICGIVFMITDFEMVAVVVSFIAGINLVVSRIINSRLSDSTSVGSSTFFNYLTGLIGSIAVLLIASLFEPVFTGITLPANIFSYLGGALGVAVVFLFNVVTPKMPTFYMTLFQFTGQVFTGVVLDIIISREFSLYNFIGGVLVAAGLAVNLLLDKKSHKQIDESD